MTVMTQQNRAFYSFPRGRNLGGGEGQDATHCSYSFSITLPWSKSHGQKRCMANIPRGACEHFCLHRYSTLLFVLRASCPCLGAHGCRVLSLASLCVDPVSRKNVKSAHSTRNRYSSQWTLTKCQASTPARTLTSDWRTVGSQHGVTVTESDSYSASLSQDTGVFRDLLESHPSCPKSPH
jgi:hypothetical protein